MRLASAGFSAAVDTAAAADWGLDHFALVEAAGRACAAGLLGAASETFVSGARIVALVGSGNNGADALVLLRALLLGGHAEAGNMLVVLKDDGKDASRKESRSPRGEALKSVSALGVRSVPWEANRTPAVVGEADLVLDGITGTGLDGALRGIAAEMAAAANSSSRNGGSRKPLVVSIDIPSGLYDAWRPGMPAVAADLTLAIEPLKASLYLPYARPLAGTIIPIGGIFPPALIADADGPILMGFSKAARSIPAVSDSSYKHERGVVEIRAGSPGATGAASLAARGAQSAGAGLVRLVVDASIRDVLAVSAGGVMVATNEEAAASSRFVPDCVLAGPGWGRGAEREAALSALFQAERSGLALVLDADAVVLSKGRRFTGNVVLTPHPGEFSAFSGIAKEEALAAPDSYLRAAAAAANAVVMLKGHVTRIAAADGRVAVVDGMTPVLAMGGSGDVLSGLTAAIVARSARAARAGGYPFDPFPAAVAAAALLAEAGRKAEREVGFCDPLDIARVAARIAADAWLGRERHGK